MVHGAFDVDTERGPAFANPCLGSAEAIRARREGRAPEIAGRGVPTGRDGLKGVAFVDAVVDGHEGGAPRWIRPAHVRCGHVCAGMTRGRADRPRVTPPCR